MKQVSFKAPVKGTVVGQVVRTQTLAINLSTAVVVTVQDKYGANHNLWINDNFSAKSGLDSILFIGNIISANVEYCVENETEYYDDFADEVFTHDTTHIRCIDASNAGDMLLTMLGFNEDFINKIELRRTTVSGEASRVRVSTILTKSDDDAIKSSIERLEKNLENMSEDLKPMALKRIEELKSKLNKS